jgi:betaine-aldehyde dehydrogenase
MTDLRNFVANEYVDSSGGRRSELVDPTTGEVFATAPVSDAADVALAYQAAERAFPAWRDATPSDRQKALLGFADAVEARGEELVELESRNTGKPLGLPRARNCHRWWTRSGSSPARHACWRAARPAST